MNSLISIVVPVYNKEPYLAECFDSLMAQTYQDIEVIMVDDGSTDGSAGICHEYCNKDKRFRYVYQNNGGENAARKTGVDLANGDWIIFVDADDYVSPDMCKLLEEKRIKTKADMVCSSHQTVKNGKLSAVYNKMSNDVYNGRAILEKEFNRKCSDTIWNPTKENLDGSICATLVRKKDVNEVLSSFEYNIRWDGDIAVLFAMFIKSKRVAYVHEICYFYRIYAESISHIHLTNLRQDMRYLGKFLVQLFRNENLPIEDYRIIDNRMLSCLLMRDQGYFNDFYGVFPFFKGDKFGKAVIYGAGVFGKEFYQSGKDINIIGWFDKNYIKYQAEDMPVRAPYELNNIDFDYILITVLRPSTAQEIKKELQQKFPKCKRIYTISHDIVDSEYSTRKMRELRGYN